MEKIDILNREKFVKQLVAIVESISINKKSTSFAIDGSWGCGKSFILNMLEKELEQVQSEETETNKYLMIRYNCWKYDYYEEPLVAIVATMLDVIEKKTKILNGEDREKIKGILKAVGATLLSGMNDAIKTRTGLDLSAAYNIIDSGISAGREEFEKINDYDKYFSFKKALKSLYEVLNELCKQYTVVFLIDELDRCLPEYGIKVLERLHHLVEGTNNIINIISVDKKRLQTSVYHIFGFNNTEEYLKKFIHFTIALDVGAVSGKFVEKHADYIELFDEEIIPYEDILEDFVREIFRKIDVREQEQLIDRIKLVHTMLFSEKKDYSFMCVELLIGVMFTHYKSKKKFCKWFDEFWGTIEESLEYPPFDNFFQTKFSNMPKNKGSRSLNTTHKYGYVLLQNDSLYSAIAFIWIHLIIGVNSSNMFIDVENNELRKVLKNNIEELQQFVELIRIVK